MHVAWIDISVNVRTAGSPWKRKLSAVITHTISQGGSYEIFFFFNIQRCIYKHCRNKRRSHTMVHQCDHEFITAVGRPDFGSRAVGRQHFLFHLFRQRLSKILPPQAFRFLQAKKNRKAQSLFYEGPAPFHSFLFHCFYSASRAYASISAVGTSAVRASSTNTASTRSRRSSLSP